MTRALEVDDRVREPLSGRVGRITEKPATLAGRVMEGWVRFTPEGRDVFASDSLGDEARFELLDGGA